jgi:hypothetical protein
MHLPIWLLSNEVLGWAAALLTLLTFVCRDMRRLRLLALAANAAFIAYGALAQLLPVLALHLALVPVNLWRLNQTLRTMERPPPAADESRRLAEPRRPRGWTPTPRAQRLRRPRPSFRPGSIASTATIGSEAGSAARVVSIENGSR